MPKKENYAAWDVKIDDFEKCLSLEEKLKFFIRFAILAPSSHNSQPWAFKIDGNKIQILAEDSRRLRASDPTDRQLFISLGAALKNLLIATDYFDFKTSIKYFPSATNLDLAAEVSFAEERKRVIRDSNHLIFAILSRVNNRSKYSPDIPATSFLEYLNNLSPKKSSMLPRGVAPDSLVDLDLDISVVIDKRKKDIMADAVMGGIRVAMQRQGFRDELVNYIISNISESKTGMPGFGLGMPLLVSLIIQPILKKFGMPKIQEKKDTELLKSHTPAFVIISTKNDDKLSWLKAGELFEEIALHAEEKNLKTAVLAAAIEIGDYHKVLQEQIGTKYRPQIFFRLGYSNEKVKHSPRLNVEDVIK